MSGDIYPNPGPLSSLSDSYDSSSSGNGSIFGTSSLSSHLSFVHYDVQSIFNKLDVSFAELSDFDILAFSETWFHSALSTVDLQLQSFQSYHSPERKDGVSDNHGGVIIYVKDTLFYRRRNDLEPLGIECLWIEIIIKHKKLLFGLFYRASNSNANYYTSIEDSISLAVDTGIKDIIIAGDFDFNMLSSNSSHKIKAICEQFSLNQVIEEPTHYTEHSSSLLDIILTNNNDHLVMSVVGDPFLQQDRRYHCPTYGILKAICKTKTKIICAPYLDLWTRWL